VTLSTETEVIFQAASDGRLDVLITQWFIANPMPDRAFSRSQVSEWIDEGRVMIGKRVITKAATKVQERTHIAVRVPAPLPTELLPEDHDFGILYQDDAILVVNKPAGLRVHPTAEDRPNSLVAGVIGRGIALAPAGGQMRPGVVHRLDKTTSGVMVLACSDPAYFALVEQFRARTMTKRYVALTAGHLPHMTGEVDAPIGRDPAHRKRFAVVSKGGKTAKSTYAVLERTPIGDRVQLELFTGRTHQLRVHLRHLGTPIMGDTLYGGTLQSAAITKLSRTAEGWGGEANRARQRLQEIIGIMRDYPGNCLHAAYLQLTHPITGESMTFEAPPPPIFEAVLKAMRTARSGD